MTTKTEAQPLSPKSPPKKSKGKRVEETSGGSERKHNYKPVKIVWTDAVAFGEWKTPTEMPEKLNTCSTLGYLVKENRQFYYVSSTVSVDDEDTDEVHLNATMIIPKKWVVSAVQINLDELKVEIIETKPKKPV